MALQETTKALADPIRRTILNLLKKVTRFKKIDKICLKYRKFGFRHSLVADFSYKLAAWKISKKKHAYAP